MNNLGKPENLNLNDIKLLDGEKVVWTGQPDPKVFGPMDWIRIPFYILWLSVALFVIWNMIHICGTAQALKGGGWLFFVWTIPIVSVGTFGIVGSFIRDYQVKKRTQFVLTNKRAIASCNWLKKSEKSRELVGLEDITKITGKDGKGSIIFDDLPQYQLRQLQWIPVQAIKLSSAPVFFDIADVDKVFRLAKGLSNGSTEQKIIEKPTEAATLPSEVSVPSLGRTLDAGPFSEYLRDGEKLLWKGQPDMNICLTRKPELMGLLVVIITASVLSISPCFVIRTIVSWKIEYSLFAWIGSLLVVFLLSLSQEVALRKNMQYAVSNQRVIELMKFAYGQTVCKYTEIANLRNMTKSLYNDGTGSLYFTPPAKGLSAWLFGQDALMFTKLNPMLRKEPIFLVLQKPDAVVRLIRDLRQKKGLADISIPGGQDRPIPMVANTSLRRVGSVRRVAPLLVARLFLFSRQAVNAWVGTSVMVIFTCIALNMFNSCNWVNILQSVGLSQTTSAHVLQANLLSSRYETKYSYLVEYTASNGVVHQATLYYDATIKPGEEIKIDYLSFLPKSATIRKATDDKGRFFDGPFQAIWAIGVLLICSTGIGFFFRQLTGGLQAIELLKTGARESGTRLPDERVLMYVNRQPSLCERNYEFTVNGNVYQAKSITSVNQPRQKKVTILFNPLNPSRAVVLDDLPGCPIISDDDSSIEFRATSDSRGYQ